jgi:hypothetical protein
MIYGSDAAFVLQFVHSDEFNARKEVPLSIEREKNVAAQTNRSGGMILAKRPASKRLWHAGGLPEER